MCPSPYIIIYGPRTSLDKVDKNIELQDWQTTKISLLSTILQCIYQYRGAGGKGLPF